MLFSTRTLPTTISVGRIRYRCGWDNHHREAHRHRIFYAFSGKVGFTFDSSETILSAGHMLVVPAGTKYNARALTDCEFFYLHFELDTVEVAPTVEPPPGHRPDVIDIPTLVALLVETERFEYLAIKSLGYRRSSDRLDKFKNDLIVFRMLMLIARVTAAQSSLPTKAGISTFYAIKQYIEVHYCEPISLSSVSRAIGVSSQYASRVFRANADCAITSFIEHIRLEQASFLLRDTTLKISEIAYSVGFSSPHYFCRRFTEAYECSPSAYRLAAFKE